MRNKTINDTKLFRLIDSGMSQAKAARELGVTRQAVSKRLIEFRGKTTRAVVSKKVEQVVDQKIDAMGQLQKINGHANWLLDHVVKWIQGDEEATQAEGIVLIGGILKDSDTLFKLASEGVESLRGLTGAEFRNGVIDHLEGVAIHTDAAYKGVFMLGRRVRDDRETLVNVLKDKFSEIDEILEMGRERFNDLATVIFTNFVCISALEGRDIGLEGRQTIAEILHLDLGGTIAQCKEEGLIKKGMNAEKV
jgi:predicted transcriptional regulator